MGPIQVVVTDANNLVLQVTPTPSTNVILDRGIAGPPGPAGTGDVTGPASSTDNAVARFDGTTGKLIQNSSVVISDAGAVTGVTNLTVDDNTILGTSNSDTVTFNARIASEFSPATDNAFDLGRTGHEWRDLFIDGTANIDSLIADTADINGGTIDGASVGATTRAAGSFTTLNANGNVTLGDATSDTITATGRFNTDLIPSTDNARDLGTAALQWKQVFATTLTENASPVVVQTDIGTAPNEIPLNQYLGANAYIDTETPALDVGTGITTGTGTICKANGGLSGGVYKVTIVIDLTGLNSGGTAGDIIGVNGTALPCYIARLPAMTVLGGRMTCLELPAGGDTDIDLFSAAEGTGVEDQAITALTETQIINAGTQALGTVTVFSAYPTLNQYLYLVGQSTSDATYTAGRFLIEIFGVQ